MYDNNSTDNTAKIAKEEGAIVRREYKQGKGNVIRRMFREIDARCYIMIDGDDTYPAECGRQMISSDRACAEISDIDYIRFYCHVCTTELFFRNDLRYDCAKKQAGI